MGQLQKLSDSLERARSQYYASTQQLAKIQNDLRVNSHELKLAKHNLKASQRVIAQRLVTLYTSDQASTLEVVLGARSLDDMITRMDSAKSVTSLDAQVLSQVKTFRTAVKRNHELLAKARVAQQHVVRAPHVASRPKLPPHVVLRRHEAGRNRDGEEEQRGQQPIEREALDGCRRRRLGHAGGRAAGSSESLNSSSFASSAAKPHCCGSKNPHSS